MVLEDQLRETIVVEEETYGTIDVSTRLYPKEYDGHFKSLLIPSDAIQSRVDALAGCLANDYGNSGQRPILVCTLKGACTFFVHLCDALQLRRMGYDLEFVRASSYAGTNSTGTVSILGELQLDSLKDRPVIIVEDIVDTGTTLSTLVPLLKAKGRPASVEVCTLVDKRLDDANLKKYTAKYVGFSVPNAFIIGYGLDYNECYRDLKVPIRGQANNPLNRIIIHPCCDRTNPPTSFIARHFGSRGSRGHGWFLKYRSGRGGRHLQGEYFDRESPEQCSAWNDAVLKLGSQRIYMDIVMEPRRSTVAIKSKTYPVPPLETLTGEKHRLTIDLAQTVMPETTKNFIDLLCQTDPTISHGYVGSRLFRVEKNVGVKGGDVLTNTGKTGKAAFGNPLLMPIRHDPLVMWHIPGTISMLIPTVGEIDSRFILVSEPAPHIDGICRAFGRLTPESLAVVDQWQTTLITTKGIPTAYDLIIVQGGLLPNEEKESSLHIPPRPPSSQPIGDIAQLAA